MIPCILTRLAKSEPDIIKYCTKYSNAPYNKYSNFPDFISPNKYNIPMYWLTTRQNRWSPKTHISYSIKTQLKIRLLLLIENLTDFQTAFLFFNSTYRVEQWKHPLIFF